MSNDLSYCVEYLLTNRRSMDRLKREAGWGSEDQEVLPKPQEGSEPEKNNAVDTKLLIAFWSCCQLER